MRILLVVVSALLALAMSTGAAMNLRPILQDVGGEILREGAPAVSIAVIADGVTTYYNAGSSMRPRLPVTNHTLYEVASITKVFTTTLLGLDIVRGEKRLQDRVQKYMPGYRLTPRMRRATFQMLATFTAGLPEALHDYTQLPRFQRGIAHYSVRKFLRGISHYAPATRLPGPRAYGDASVGLLGLCLGDLHLATWENRLQTEIFAPLGMKDTAVVLTPGQRQRLARGREPDGATAPWWPIDAMAASDAVKSTTFDLARFLSALLGEDGNASTELQEAMAVATRPQFRVHFHVFDEYQALAWRKIPLLVKGHTYWITTKSGDLPGFSSEISFDRDLGVGVAILASCSQLDLTDFEEDIIKRVAQRN